MDGLKVGEAAARDGVVAADAPLPGARSASSSRPAPPPATGSTALRELNQLRSLADLRRRFGLEISDLVFAARLRREPDLRKAVDGWLAGADDLAWVEWEQRKHERLLAA